MAVKVSDRSEAKLEALEKTFEFVQYTLQLCNNEKIFPTGKIIVTLLPASVSREKRRLRKQVRTLPREKVDQCYASWKSFVEPPKHSKRHPERRIKRNTHSLIKYMDEYYETLWKEQEEHAESSEQRQQCEGTEQG